MSSDPALKPSHQLAPAAPSPGVTLAARRTLTYFLANLPPGVALSHTPPAINIRDLVHTTKLQTTGLALHTFPPVRASEQRTAPQTAGAGNSQPSDVFKARM